MSPEDAKATLVRMPVVVDTRQRPCLITCHKSLRKTRATSEQPPGKKVHRNRKARMADPGTSQAAPKSPPPSLSIASSGEKPSSRRQRRRQGLRGVYLTRLEESICNFFGSKADAQKEGGWNVANAPVLTLDDVRTATTSDSTATDAQILEAVGRMCSADLLQCIATETYRLAWNPQDVIVKSTERRRVMATRERLAQVDTIRSIARSLVQENGVIDSTRFSKRSADTLKMTRSSVMNLSLAYSPETDARSGGSLRILISRSEGGTELLLAPKSLSGCNFFLHEGWRSRLVPADKSLYSDRVKRLQEHYQALTKFKGETTETPSEPHGPSTAPATPPAAPLPSTPKETSVSAGDDLSRLLLKKEALVRRSARF